MISAIFGSFRLRRFLGEIGPSAPDSPYKIRHSRKEAAPSQELQSRGNPIAPTGGASGKMLRCKNNQGWCAMSRVTKLLLWALGAVLGAALYFVFNLWGAV